MKKRGQLDRNKDNTRKKTKNTDSRPFFFVLTCLSYLENLFPSLPSYAPHPSLLTIYCGPRGAT